MDVNMRFQGRYMIRDFAPHVLEAKSLIEAEAKSKQVKVAFDLTQDLMQPSTHTLRVFTNEDADAFEAVRKVFDDSLDKGMPLLVQNAANLLNKIRHTVTKEVPVLTTDALAPHFFQWPHSVNQQDVPGKVLFDVSSGDKLDDKIS